MGDIELGDLYEMTLMALRKPDKRMFGVAERPSHRAAKDFKYEHNRMRSAVRFDIDDDMLEKAFEDPVWTGMQSKHTKDVTARCQNMASAHDEFQLPFRNCWFEFDGMSYNKLAYMDVKVVGYEGEDVLEEMPFLAQVNVPNKSGLATWEDAEPIGDEALAAHEFILGSESEEDEESLYLDHKVRRFSSIGVWATQSPKKEEITFTVFGLFSTPQEKDTTPIKTYRRIYEARFPLVYRIGDSYRNLVKSQTSFGKLPKSILDRQPNETLQDHKERAYSRMKIAVGYIPGVKPDNVLDMPLEFLKMCNETSLISTKDQYGLDQSSWAAGDQELWNRKIIQLIWTIVSMLNYPWVSKEPVSVKRSKKSRRPKIKPYDSYYRCGINLPKPMGIEIADQKPRADSYGKRLHQVRGHWRVYKDEFGDVKRRTWITEHRRGDAKLGVVHKDYHLKAKKNKDTSDEI